MNFSAENAFRSSVVKKRQWLTDHDIPEKQYYYWLRRVRKAAFSQMEPQLPALQSKAETSIVQFPAAEILSEDPRTPAIIIRTKKSTIELLFMIIPTLFVELRYFKPDSVFT